MICNNRLRLRLAARLMLMVAVSTMALPASGLIGRPSPSAKFAISPEIEGYYLLHGPAPKGFENVDHLALFLGAGKAAGTPASGLYLKNNSVYRLRSPSISRERLAFTTTAVRGISYAFDGRFLSPTPAEADPDTPVLTGRLSKFLNGRKTAEGEVSWTYYTGD